MNDQRFWQAVDVLVAACEVVIDRPAGSTHPRFADFRYPLDYGYLQDTTSPDGHEIDVWRGSLVEPTVTAVVCTVDALKRDAELKILIGCTEDQIQTILDLHNSGPQAATLVRRP